MLLAACEKTTEPSGEPSGNAGAISFNFTGGGGGTFSATGVPPANPVLPGTTNWAAGYQDPVDGVTGGAGILLEGGTYDFVIFGVQRLSVGTEPVDADCDADAGNCTGLFFVINGQGSTVASFDNICALLTGSFTITEVTATRVKGTFSGGGECTSSTQTISVFSVSSGSFDLPLIPEP
jgi:hypothetical protein